jgi:hypothetical protein
MISMVGFDISLLSRFKVLKNRFTATLPNHTVRTMSSAISNLVTLLEKLPDSMQDNVLNHVRAYLEELEREQRWETTFLKLQEAVTVKS